MKGFELFHLESPLGTILQSFREEAQALAWAAKNVPAGQQWILRKWIIAQSIHAAGIGPPTPPTVLTGGVSSAQNPSGLSYQPPPSEQTQVTFQVTHNPGQNPIE